MEHWDPEKDALHAQDREGERPLEAKALNEKIPASPANASGLHSTRSSVTIQDDSQAADDLEVDADQHRPSFTTAYADPVKVPRSQRRGLLGRFSILAEVDEPKAYSRKTKW